MTARTITSVVSPHLQECDTVKNAAHDTIRESETIKRHLIPRSGPHLQQSETRKRVESSFCVRLLCGLYSYVGPAIRCEKTVPDSKR